MVPERYSEFYCCLFICFLLSSCAQLHAYSLCLAVRLTDFAFSRATDRRRGTFEFLSFLTIAGIQHLAWQPKRNRNKNLRGRMIFLSVLLKLLSLGSVSEEKILRPFPSTLSSARKATEWRQSYPRLVMWKRKEWRQIKNLISYLFSSDVEGLWCRSLSEGSPLQRLQKTCRFLWETINSRTHKIEPLWIWSLPVMRNLLSELTEWHWNHSVLPEMQDKAKVSTLTLSVCQWSLSCSRAMSFLKL